MSCHAYEKDHANNIMEMKSGQDLAETLHIFWLRTPKLVMAQEFSGVAPLFTVSSVLSLKGACVIFSLNFCSFLIGRDDVGSK